MVIVDYLAPCSRTGPVADLDMAYHMPQPYAKTGIWLNFISPTCFAAAAGMALRGGRGFALGIVVWLVSGFAIWYVTDPLIWHHLCGA
jgi:hypothetical protein